jgi:hypothetical protein
MFVRPVSNDIRAMAQSVLYADSPNNYRGSRPSSGQRAALAVVWLAVTMPKSLSGESAARYVAGGDCTIHWRHLRPWGGWCWPYTPFSYADTFKCTSCFDIFLISQMGDTCNQHGAVYGMWHFLRLFCV